ncbi:MAG: TM0106 family RecB-like putative nuclease [Candidatus Woesearchaeota archaeon]
MELFEQCLAGKRRSKFTITGHTVLKYCISPFLVWCDAFAPPEEREPESRYMHLLFERGIQHEKEVRTKLFRDAVEIPILSFETGFRQVLDECKKGVKAITGAPLFFLQEDMYGILDVLERRNDHSSVFGNYYYVVKEIKSAKNIKHEYIMQTAFYTYLLGRVQGYTPSKFYLINRENEETEYSYDDYKESLMLALADIREIFNGKKISPTAKACKWPWEAYCNKLAVAADDVSILPHVGPALKKKLNDAGIFTVRQLATQPFEVDIPDATLKKIRLYAQAFVDKKPIILSKPKLPKADVELFLDFEGTDELETEEGMVKTDYLIGLLVKDREGVHFRPFVAETLADEGRMLHNFLAFIRKFPGAPIYHYGPYERTHIAALAQKYKLDLSHVLDNMVDVLALVRKHVIFPTMTMSLKEVSKFLGFKYRGMADAQESIVLYLQFLETKESELLKRILDYNEDDVRATMLIKDYLAGL